MWRFKRLLMRIIFLCKTLYLKIKQRKQIQRREENFRIPVAGSKDLSSFNNVTLRSLHGENSSTDILALGN
jgi:hypothetical protein